MTSSHSPLHSPSQSFSPSRLSFVPFPTHLSRHRVRRGDPDQKHFEVLQPAQRLQRTSPRGQADAERGGGAGGEGEGPLPQRGGMRRAGEIGTGKAAGGSGEGVRRRGEGRGLQTRCISHACSPLLQKLEFPPIPMSKVLPPRPPDIQVLPPRPPDIEMFLRIKELLERDARVRGVLPERVDAEQSEIRQG